MRQPDVREEQEEYEEHAVGDCVGGRLRGDLDRLGIGSSTGQRDPGGRVREVRVPPRSVGNTSEL